MERKIRIGWGGDSITRGCGVVDASWDAPPAVLKRILGLGYKIFNWGINGATLLKRGYSPWWKSTYFSRAQRDEYDIGIIALGTNDTSKRDRRWYGDMIYDAKDLIGIFQNSPGHPRVIVLLPIALPADQDDDALVNEVNPRIRQAAEEMGVEVLDGHPLFMEGGLQRTEFYIPDCIHPNEVGSAMIAKAVAEFITNPRVN
jgi:lysophospholipase L1-like esterase